MKVFSIYYQNIETELKDHFSFLRYGLSKICPENPKFYKILKKSADVSMTEKVLGDSF